MTVASRSQGSAKIKQTDRQNGESHFACLFVWKRVKFSKRMVYTNRVDKVNDFKAYRLFSHLYLSFEADLIGKLMLG